MKVSCISLLLKRKAVSGVTLLVFDFVLRQNTKLPTNTTNKSKNDSFYFSERPNSFTMTSLMAKEGKEKRGGLSVLWIDTTRAS
jgi:hypothetical protein